MWLRTACWWANHSALLDSQGIVFVAGDNTYGQLGLCTNPPTSGVQVFVHAPIDTSIDDPVVHIACGWNTTFAVTRSGIVWVAGSNSHGQAGLAQSAKQTHLGSTSGFVCISIVCPQLPPISQIACGLRHTLFLALDGSLWGCGSNKYGELLDASDPDHVSIKSLVFHPQRIHGLGGIVRSMACGQHHSIAIVTAPQDGKPLDESTLLVKTFGRNRYGQLGISPQVSPHTQGSLADKLISVSVQLPFAELPQSVFAGWFTSGVVCVSGRLIMWGRNDHGQLGSLRNTPAASATDSLSLLDPSWTPHTVLYGDRPESHSSIRTTLSSETPLSVRTVASGSEHTVVAAVLQLDEGSPKVQCLSWGWNEHGNCGVANNSDVLSPTSITDLPPAIVGCVLGAGAGHTLIWISH
ncbi:hypothetical protein BASA81_012684 [Batrachochytrium salamandrivorans]|nr:hypothetical protein BASA81_012684 [Batrachochytrium salamandrivorans]